MATAINGTNIILYQYDSTSGLSVPFAAATSCTFQVSTDQTEVTSQSSAWFKEFKNDVSTWTVTCDGLISLSTSYNYLLLLQKQLDRSPIVIKFSIDNDNGGTTSLGYSVFSGTANITSISLSGAAENTATYSVSLQGTGVYSISGTSPTPGGTVIVGSNVTMQQYTAAGGETTITFTSMIGYSCLSVTRGGVEVRTISTSGTATGEDVVFNSSTGVLTFARVLESDEFVRALFK